MSNFTSVKNKAQALVGDVIPLALNSRLQLQNHQLLNGSILSQSTYPELYSMVGLIKNTFTWTARTSAATGINALIYENSLFVYAGTGGAIATSTDGVTWTTRTSGTASVLYALTYGNGHIFWHTV